eukprot:s2024_g2.t1
MIEAKGETNYWPVYVTIFITVFVAVFADKFLAKFVAAMQNKATNLVTPKEEQIRTPATKRTRAEDAAEALPVEPMDVEDETFEWSKEVALAFYQRTKAMHEDYVNMTEQQLRIKDQKIRELECAEGIASDKAKTTEEYAEMLSLHRDKEKDMVRDLRVQLATAESDKNEARQSYEDMSAAYNVAISEKKNLETQLRQALQDRDKFLGQFNQAKARVDSEFKAKKDFEKEMNEYKEKYEHLVMLTTKTPETPGQSPVTPTEVLEARQTMEGQKKVKEGIKMTMADLENAYDRLAKENELYRRHNVKLQADLNKAKAPEEILISRTGACYHRGDCLHCPSSSSKFRKCKDCMP